MRCGNGNNFPQFFKNRYIGRNHLIKTVSKFKFHIIWDGHFQIKLIVLSKLHFYTDLVLLHNTKEVQNYTEMKTGENFKNSQPQVKIH